MKHVEKRKYLKEENNKWYLICEELYKDDIKFYDKIKKKQVNPEKYKIQKNLDYILLHKYFYDEYENNEYIYKIKIKDEYYLNEKILKNKENYDPDYVVKRKWKEDNKIHIYKLEECNGVILHEKYLILPEDYIPYKVAQYVNKILRDIYKKLKEKYFDLVRKKKFSDVIVPIVNLLSIPLPFLKYVADLLESYSDYLEEKDFNDLYNKIKKEFLNKEQKDIVEKIDFLFNELIKKVPEEYREDAEIDKEKLHRDLMRSLKENAIPFKRSQYNLEKI